MTPSPSRAVSLPFPPRRRRLWPAQVAALAATVWCAPSLRADEVRLDDGRVVVGKVVDKGDTLEITTRDGVVLVAKSQLRSLRRDDELRQVLTSQAREQADSAFAHLHLAMQARAFGLEPEMWRHLDRAVSMPAPADPTDPANDLAAAEPQANGQVAGNQPAAQPSTGGGPTARGPLQRRIDDFLAQLEPELLARKWRSADTRVRVHQLLEGLRADAGPGRRAAVVELLLREPNADQDLRTEARRNATERRRIAALCALQRRELAGNDHFVLRTAIVDASPEVRQAAIQLRAGHDDTAAVAYLAPGLMHSNAKVRMRTAEAFGELGDASAVKLLVLAGPNAGMALAAADQGVRGHVAFLQQQSYIRDFDVEVAQSAFIADPKVDTLQSGTVLDVTVVGVDIERIITHYRRALQKLTRSDPGANPRNWATWLANQPEPVMPAPTGRR